MNEEINIQNNSEIKEALKQFEREAGAEQMPKSPENSEKSEIPKIVRLMMKWSGLEQKKAEYVLLGFAVIAILISLFLFLKEGSKRQMLTPETIKKMNESVSPGSLL